VRDVEDQRPIGPETEPITQEMNRLLRFNFTIASWERSLGISDSILLILVWAGQTCTTVELRKSNSK
jgi:hypothetical protein